MRKSRKISVSAQPAKSSVSDKSVTESTKEKSAQKNNSGFSAIIQADEATQGLMRDIQKGITSEITLPAKQISGKIDELTDAIESISRNSKNAAEDANEAKKAAKSADEKADNAETLLIELTANIKKIESEQNDIKKKLDSILALLNGTKGEKDGVK